jgi:hypothetical protein
MIDAHLKKIRHGENADAKSECEAMIITPLFDAWHDGRCPMSLAQFEAEMNTLMGMHCLTIY